MDYVYLKEFLADYSLPTLVIALVVTLISLVSDKLFRDKIPTVLKTYLPFALSIIFNFIYDNVMVYGDLTVRSDTFYAGLLSGSLSALAVGLICKVKRGEPVSVSAPAVIIESIICGYVDEKILAKVALAIEKLYVGGDSGKVQEKTAEIIKTHTNQTVSDQECLGLANLIAQAVKAVKG